MHKMRNLVLILFSLGLIVHPCFSQSVDADFLNYFFQNPNIKRTNIPFSDKSNSELILVVDSGLDGGITTQKAIVYLKNKNKYRILIIILGPYIFGGDGQILVDVSTAPGVYWGWRINPGFNKATGEFVNLEFVLRSNKGEKIADSILLPWNYDLESFYVFRPDSSQF